MICAGVRPGIAPKSSRSITVEFSSPNRSPPRPRRRSTRARSVCSWIPGVSPRSNGGRPSAQADARPPHTPQASPPPRVPHIEAAQPSGERGGGLQPPKTANAATSAPEADEATVADQADRHHAEEGGGEGWRSE